MINKRSFFSIGLTVLVSSCSAIKTKYIKPIYPTGLPDSTDNSDQYHSTDSNTKSNEDHAHNDHEEILGRIITESNSSINSEEEASEPLFLKDVNNEKVKFWVEYFTKKDKNRFERYLSNGAKYQSTIEEILIDHGLPKELYYVGLIESGYNLKARSHANAVGPWQFIKSTAKRYGLNVKYGIDERKSIHKSTKAAALFFQDLYNIFGSWELALSAYNAGEYGIIRRIREANTRDYYQLSAAKSIPKETRHYVPKVLAVIKILKDPSKYNIKIPKQTRPYKNTKFIELKRSYNLSQIATQTGVSVKELRNLNPDLLMNKTPYLKNRVFNLRVPNGNYAFIDKLKSRTVASNFNKNPLKRKSYQNKYYRVQAGENLTKIAKKLNVDLKNLKRANSIKDSNHLVVGKKLNIPLNISNDNSEVKASNTVYIVKRGDNLYSIARKQHTSVSEIMKLNKMTTKTIYSGSVLKIPDVEKTFYTVRPGDYLGKIASRFGLSLTEIKRLNSMQKSRIFPGQRLVVKLEQ